MAVKGCSRGFSRGWVVAASLALTLLAAEANLAARWTAVQAPGEAAPVAAARYAPDRVVVKLTPEAALAVMGRGGATSPGLARALQAVGAQGVRPLFADLWPSGQAGPIRAADKLKRVRAKFPQRAARADPMAAAPDLENVFLVTLEAGQSVESAVARLGRDRSVVYAEPDYLASVCLIPSDPNYESMWNLLKIRAEEAWDVTTGSDSVIIAVVDTGIDYDHPDIVDRIWENAEEVGGVPLIDDDDNGFVDDERGWDFAYDDNDPMDGHGHGTHVSGTIGASTNNYVGIAGVTWQGKMMAVKGLSDAGSGTDSDLTDAMRYAVDNGADVMNNSWGGIGVSQLEQDAIDYAMAAGCIVVAAAGNDAVDAQWFAPAGQRDVVCVGATGSGDLRASFSNYGERVDVSAPGESILSLAAGGSSYTYMSGTSMAAPHVSGALGLLIAEHPAWTIAQLVGQLDGTAEDIDGLNPDYAGLLGLGRIDLAESLTGTPSGQRIILLEYAADDQLGDDDGQIEPGERIRLEVVLKHFTATSTNVAATLTSNDSYVTIVDGSTSFGTLSGWRSADNGSDRFQFDVSAEWPAERQLVLTLTVTADGGYSRDYEIRVPQWAGYCLGGAGPWWPWAEWDEEEEALGLYLNLDDFAWEPSAGYQLVAEGEMDRWGVITVPLTDSVPSGELAWFFFQVIGPPLSTLRYELPVTPTAPGTSDGLSCGWELCKGYFPLWGGASSEEVVVSRFPDVQPWTVGEWARFYVEECAGRVPLIVAGYQEADGSYTYRPANTVDRGAMAVYMTRSLKLPTAPYEGSFPADVPESHWAWAWIEALARAGLVQGYGSGYYQPGLTVNRDAMAVYVARGIHGGIDVPTGPEEPTFSDVAPTYWAYDAIEYAVAHGVVRGYDDGTYRPIYPVDRGQMAVYVYRGFIQPTGTAVVLGGPAITAVDPETAGYWGWSSRSSMPSSDPGYAYVVLDAVRLDSNLCDGDSFFDVYFELRGPETPSETVQLSDSDISTAKGEAMGSGVPYLAISWDIPAGLTAGEYTLVVSVEDETGAMHEITRRPTLTITP